MEHMSTGTRATDPELDEALSRAIRQLIAEAIVAGEGDSASAAALAAGSNAPGLVWMGGTLALCTKGALAMTLGVSLRKHVPDRLARTIASSSCFVLGLISLRELLAS